MVPAPRLRPLFTIVLLGLLFTAPGATAEETDLFAGFELRGIGPALMSGRISHRASARATRSACRTAKVLGRSSA